MEAPDPEAIPKETDPEAYKLWWSAQRKKYAQQRREKEQAILKKSVELLSQSREMSIKEKIILRKAEEIKARRLRMNEGSKRRHQKKRALDKFKEIEGINNVKQSETNKRCEEKIKELETAALESFKSQRAAQARQDRLKKREKEESILKNASELLSRNQELTSEEKEVLRLAEKVRADKLRKKAFLAEKQKLYRQLKREKEESILKKAQELLSQTQEMSSEEKDVLRQAEQIKACRLKNSQHTKQYILKRGKELSLEEKEAQKLKTRQYLQKRREQKDADDERRLTKDQTIPVDDIKIENEVLQEATIETIVPTRKNAVANLVSKHEGSSCSRLKLEEINYVTRRTSKSRKPQFQSFLRGSAYHINSNSYHSSQLDRRRPRLEESLRCMRELIDATKIRDTHDVFGKQIAQKLRASEMDVEEIGIAKLLIDNVLQNLAIGVYNDDTKFI